ncbi:hypothetical protein Hypma_007502 [Hypsizygus marmoreus]|uniref:Uncharacterized protein n=1 Tax=Hypsizygus marmoreus TaxID=39966 RepID=A0A369JX33_HYPMA|nr:hypothetical protein Hypma_007502 [Hypsizygus marmoreus]
MNTPVSLNPKQNYPHRFYNLSVSPPPPSRRLMTNLVPLSNTDARLLRAITLGTGVKDGTMNIQTILENAQEVMDDATVKLLDQRDSMEVKDFDIFSEILARHCHDVLRMVKQVETYDGLPITAQSYRAVKAEAESCLAVCCKLRKNIQIASRCSWAPRAEKHNEKDDEQCEYKKADPCSTVLVPEEHPALPSLPHIRDEEQLNEFGLSIC